MAKTKLNASEGQAENPQNVIPQDLLNSALNAKIEVTDRVEKTVKPDSFNAVINEVVSTYNVTPAIALVGLIAILQAGGTNKNKRSNVKISLGGTSFESKTINKVIAKHCPDFTPRQFATYFRNIIYMIARKHNITGNAYVSLRRQYSHLLSEASAEEKFWAADFQLDNPKCPEYLRNALQQRYNDKFVKK
ncbi:MAG: hypothetical protein ABEI13_03085 [Candidatus Paceibacteria bacterium]